jgi:hypothetical protein
VERYGPKAQRARARPEWRICSWLLVKLRFAKTQARGYGRGHTHIHKHIYLYKTVILILPATATSRPAKPDVDAVNRTQKQPHDNAARLTRKTHPQNPPPSWSTSGYTAVDFPPSVHTISVIDRCFNTNLRPTFLLLCALVQILPNRLSSQQRHFCLQRSNKSVFALCSTLQNQNQSI